MRHWVTRASDEEYDCVIKTQPYLCRPLSGDMGDYRSAKHALVRPCCAAVASLLRSCCALLHCIAAWATTAPPSTP